MRSCFDAAVLFPLRMFSFFGILYRDVDERDRNYEQQKSHCARHHLAIAEASRWRSRLPAAPPSGVCRRRMSRSYSMPAHQFIAHVEHFHAGTTCTDASACACRQRRTPCRWCTGEPSQGARVQVLARRRVDARRDHLHVVGHKVVESHVVEPRRGGCRPFERRRTLTTLPISDMVWRDTPSASATSCWLKPCLRRSFDSFSSSTPFLSPSPFPSPPLSRKPRAEKSKSSWRFRRIPLTPSLARLREKPPMPGFQ